MFFVAGARQPSLRFDLKTLSAAPALSKVTLDIDGHRVVYLLRASSVINPFRHDGFEQFRCPTSL